MSKKRVPPDAPSAATAVPADVINIKNVEMNNLVNTFMTYLFSHLSNQQDKVGMVATR